MNSRRRRGSGSIYCDRGSLYVSFRGKRIATGLPDTKENRKLLAEQLDKAYMRFTLDKINVFDRTENKMTVGVAWREFLEKYASAKSPKTNEWYSISYNHFFKNSDVVLDPAHLERHLIDVITTSKNISPTSVLTYLRGVSAFLNWCHKRRYLSDLPDFDDLRSHIANVPLPDPDIYTLEELNKLRTYFRLHDSIMADIVDICCSTGFRIHEVLEITWEDIRDDHVLQTSKDNRRRERFPLWSEARTVFDAIRRERAAEFNVDPSVLSGRLFPGLEWNQTTYYSLRRRLTSGMQKAGIAVVKGRKYHEFRKTFISRICRSGVPIDQAAKIARCSVATMMKYYRSFSMAELSQGMDRVAAAEPLITSREAR